MVRDAVSCLLLLLTLRTQKASGLTCCEIPSSGAAVAFPGRQFYVAWMCIALSGLERSTLGAHSPRPEMIPRLIRREVRLSFRDIELSEERRSRNVNELLLCIRAGATRIPKLAGKPRTSDGSLKSSKRPGHRMQQDKGKPAKEQPRSAMAKTSVHRSPSDRL